MARPSTIVAISAGLFAGLFASVVHAQRTNATCQATYSWMKNDQGQDPCLLASYLSMPCAGSQGTWNSQPLTSQQYYLSPTAQNANPCLCSAVFYSVVSACAYCQGATVSTWFQWTPSCSSYQSITYTATVPPGTSIPGWATLPIPPSGTWDSTAAYNYALSSSASITLGGSTAAASTSGSPSRSIDPTSSGASPAPTNTSTSTNGSALGAAIGGAIGGIGLLAGLGFVIWYFCIKKSSDRQKVNHNPDGFDHPGKINSPPIQVQPWNPDAPLSQPNTVPYYPVATPVPQAMSPPPVSSTISYVSPQPTYAPQPSHYSGPGSDVGGPTVYSESHSGYGAAPSTVSYGIANPGPSQQYPPQDQYAASATSYNPNAGYNNAASIYQQPASSANPLLEGFEGGIHAPPPRYETPAPGSSMMGAGAPAAPGAPVWPNEKR